MSKEDAVGPATSVRILESPSDDEAWLQIDLRIGLDQIAAIESEHLRAAQRPAPSRADLIELARRIYDARRTRYRIFDKRVFGEPAWDMLLALYIFPPRGEMLSVSSLSYSAFVPVTTGLRWQSTLMEHDLIERGPKGTDARRQFIRLTANGRELLEKYLTRLYYVDGSKPPWPIG